MRDCLYNSDNIKCKTIALEMIEFIFFVHVLTVRRHLLITTLER